MRTLTVSSFHREWGKHHRIHARVPAIRLSGRWLARAGFAIGSKVKVRVESGALTIQST